jgi:mandelamide amidase
MSDASQLTAVEAVEHIRTGALKAEAYAARLIERQRTLKHLNAITWMDEGRLLEAARGVDQARSRGNHLGPLAGLPVVVKDNIDTLGFPTSAGTASLKGLMPKAEAPVTAALWRAGALLFGKANMHELAGGGTSTNPAFGFIRNPYDPKRTPGGSSGGTAAALAARIVAAGLGSDTAGSVRIPSAFSGTAALRPSIAGARKLYSNDGVVPLASDLDTVGPMARNVADVALLHSAITGQTVPPVSLKGTRIGIPRSHYWENLDDDVRAVADAALARLRDAGAALVDIAVADFIAATQSVFQTLLLNGFKGDLAIYFSRNALPYDAADVIGRIESRDTQGLFAMARDTQFPPGAVDAARTTLRAKVQAQYADILRSHGLAAVAFPTEPMTAPLIPADGDSFNDMVNVAGKPINKVLVLIRNTGLTCALGVPGISLPAGLTAAGLPVGLELDGWAGGDAALLGLGMAAEAAIGRIPPPALAAAATVP